MPTCHFIDCRLFSDTEIRKDDIQQLFNIHCTGDAAQNTLREPQILGYELKADFAGRLSAG